MIKPLLTLVLLIMRAFAGKLTSAHDDNRRLSFAIPREGEWKPDLRKELGDVRSGIHRILDAMMQSPEISCREKIILELLRNTGARLHEVVRLSVGGYRNQGIAGQAQVVSKGSLGREVKTIYFAHHPRVMRLLTRYLEQIRPGWDAQGRRRLDVMESGEPLFLTERGTPYAVKSFYYHWYKHYPSFRSLCPVTFSPHDIRHLFITEFLIMLRQECGAGTDHFDTERYQREREAFGSTIMGWQSIHTIDVYDHSRDREHTLQVLALMQQRLAERDYLPAFAPGTHASPPTQAEAIPTAPPPRLPAEEDTLWLHDAETLAWIKKMQQQS